MLVYAETTGTVQNKLDTPVADRPRMPESEFTSYGDKLTELAEWLRSRACAMTFHHHMGTVVETEREVDLLMSQTGEAVGLLFDTGHLHLRRRRRRSPRRGATASASTTSTARTSGRTCSTELQRQQLVASSRAWSRACSRCRATA